MFEFLLNPIVLAPVCLVIGAFIGIGLGRRSNTANTAYDNIRAQYEIREAQLRDRLEGAEAQIKALRDKVKG